MSLAGNLQKCAACGEVHYTGVPEECRRKLRSGVQVTPSHRADPVVPKRKPVKASFDKSAIKPIEKNPDPRVEVERVREIVDEDAKVVPVRFRISQSMSDWVDSVRGGVKRSAWIRDLIERERSGG